MGFILFGAYCLGNMLAAERLVRPLRLRNTTERLLAGFIAFWAFWIVVIYLAGAIHWITTTGVLLLQAAGLACIWVATWKADHHFGVWNLALTALSRLRSNVRLNGFGRLLRTSVSRWKWHDWAIAASVACVAAGTGIWLIWTAQRMLTLPISDYDSTSIYGIQLALMIQSQTIAIWPWGHPAVSTRPLNGPIMMLLFTLPFGSMAYTQLFRLLTVPAQLLCLHRLSRLAGASRALAAALAFVPFACHSYVTQFDLSLLYDDVIALFCLLAFLWGVRALQAGVEVPGRSYVILLAACSGILIGLRLRSGTFLLVLHCALGLILMLKGWKTRAAAPLLRHWLAYPAAAVVLTALLGGVHRYAQTGLAYESAEQTAGPLAAAATPTPSDPVVPTAHAEATDTNDLTPSPPDSTDQGLILENVLSADGKALIRHDGLKILTRTWERYWYFITGPVTDEQFAYFFSTHLGFPGSVLGIAGPVILLLLAWKVCRRSDSHCRVAFVALGCAALYAAVAAYYHHWENPDGRYYLASLYLAVPAFAFLVRRLAWAQVGLASLVAVAAVMTMAGQRDGSFLAPSRWVEQYSALQPELQSFGTFHSYVGKGFEDLTAFHLVECNVPPSAVIARHSGKSYDVHLFGEDLKRRVVYVQDPRTLEQLEQKSPVDYVMIHHPFDPMSLWYAEARRDDNTLPKRLFRYCLDHPEKYRLIYPDPKRMEEVARREVIFKVVDPQIASDLDQTNFR